MDDLQDIQVAAIASGSNGNCYYINTSEGAFLVDVGISYKMLYNRTKELGINLEKIRAILVSHEHSDHIKGIERTVKELKIPVFITRQTLQASRFIVDKKFIEFFEPNRKFEIGNITISPISKNHDAVEPCSFMISNNKYNIAILTDIGQPCANVINCIKEADVAFLEANYDEDMLLNSRYTYHLKKRVSGKKGHLSNYEAALLILEHATPRLKKILLSHISENNNTPELAYKTFTVITQERKDLNIETILTSREDTTPIISVTPQDVKIICNTN